MTSYIQLLNKIEAFCLAHKQIQKYGGEFREQMPNFSTKDTKYPMVFVSPSGGAPLYDTNEITLDIYCVDIIQKGRENLNTIVSDCHLILTDLYIYFSQGSDLTIDVLGTPSQTPLNNLDLDYVAGWMMTITFQVEGWCVAAIPMGDIPSGQGCEDATYIVEYADGTPIESGTIASGATKTIEVPNCPACEDATAELYFEDELIDTITVPCGDTGSFEIGCSNLMNAVKVVSTWQQHKHGGTFKHIGEENGKPKYEALHDPTKTIVYDGTKWQIIKTAPDAHVHNAANGNEAFPWLATWLDDYLTVTQATVGSFCTNGGIAYYNLVDTDGNLLAEGSISEGDEDNIVAPDATYSNSDNSYSGSVLSGGSLSLPDETIIVTDENDNVLDTITFPVYENQTINLSSYVSCPTGAKPIKTGQTVSYASEDDGGTQRGRLVDFFTLDSNNAFGNTNRFTDLTGGQTYASNGVFLDHSTDDGSSILAFTNSPTNTDWSTTLGLIAAQTTDGKTDWYMPNRNELNLLINEGANPNLNWTPLTTVATPFSGSISCWTSTTPISNTARAKIFYNVNSIDGNEMRTQGKTLGARSLACRYYTYAELGL